CRLDATEAGVGEERMQGHQCALLAPGRRRSIDASAMKGPYHRCVRRALRSEIPNVTRHKALGAYHSAHFAHSRASISHKVDCERRNRDVMARVSAREHLRSGYFERNGGMHQPLP